MKNNSLLTTKAAAKFLGVSISTIYRMSMGNILNPIRTPGGQRRFEISDLEKYKQDSRNIKAPQNPSTIQSLHSIAVHDEAVAQYLFEKESNKVDTRNKLNELSASEWLPETKSFWMQKGLGSNHPHAQIERQHPAPFSFQDVGRLIRFFTKRGEKVLDPFSGVGSTLKACSLLGRIGTGIEISEKWNSLAKLRLENEVGKNESLKHAIITADCIKELKLIEDNVFDFMVTSPPYWSILNKKADHKVKNGRLKFNLATNYSKDEKDLGNIKDYKVFIETLVEKVFIECGRVIKPNKFMCIIVSDFRNKSEFVSFHSDLINRLNKAVIKNEYCILLQGVKILAQNHKTLIPYGYPFTYVENIHHQYILIFKKTQNNKV